MALTAIFLLCASLLAASVGAQTRKNIRGRQYIFCPCSTTTRGYRTEVAQELFEAMYEISKKQADVRREGTNAQVKTARIVIYSQEKWQGCVDNHSLEECVNADTALRAQQGAGGCYPDCASFCEYDPGSWKNNANGRYGPACDSDPKWSSREPVITKGRFPREVSRTTSNPNPGAEKPAGSAINTRPKRPISPAAGTSTPGGPVSGAQPTASRPDGGSSSVEPGVDLFAPEPPPTPGAFNEGCVAVDNFPPHAVLQHREHLVRSVLCHNEFCATPNHALIVAGRWTSMKQLCATWTCVRTVKLVNNLKAFANSRFTFGDITVTPYDIRYPRWCVWVIHLIQHLGIASYSTFVVAVASTLVAVAVGARLKSRYPH